MTLPAGIAISPSAAGGRGACTPDRDRTGRRCKDALLPEPVEDRRSEDRHAAARSTAEGRGLSRPAGERPRLRLVRTSGRLAARALPRGRSGWRADQARRARSKRTRYGTADGRFDEHPATAVRRTGAEPLRRRTGAARDPGRVRLLRGHSTADAVERHARGDADRRTWSSPRDRTAALPERAFSPSFTAGTSTTGRACRARSR